MAEEKGDVSPDVEYLRQNYDNEAQNAYMAANTPGAVVTDTRPEALPESEIPPTTTEGKPVVVLQNPGETVAEPGA